MPQKAAGPRMEPPVSEPVAPTTSPAARAAPEPLLEPPGMCVEVPRIAGRQEAMAGQLEAERELMGDEFAQEDGAGLLPALHTRRVVLGEPVGEEGGTARRADARV